jgi:cytochrome P450
MFNPRLTDAERARMEGATRELEDYLRRSIAERRARPANDLLSALVAVEERGDQLTDAEIVTMCGLLLAAGNVTTTDLIGNGVWTLLRHPAELAKLRANPALIKNAVEELLRFEPPVMQTGRLASEDVTIGGCSIGRGESVLSLLAAANRDPAACPDPDRFDISRADVCHHSFGGGAHYCLGAPLARLEAQIALGRLFERFPNLRLVDEPPEWRGIPAFRGLVRLHLHP